MRVFVCIQGAARILEGLRAALPEDDVVECPEDDVVRVAGEADVIVPCLAPVGDEALRSPRLRLVQQFGAGLDTVDVAAAARRGVYVANVRTDETANAPSVAELVLLMMLALSRRLKRAEENVRLRRVGSPTGTTLLGTTAVILGYGGIGREVAARLAPFGVRVVAVSRGGPRGDDGPVDRHVPVSSLHEVLTEADFLIVATPLDASTRGLVDRRVLASLKPGAYLVNVARGGIVDREALLDALAAGRLAGAGLDVFWQEPVDPDDPLLAHNVIATPHIGGSTDASFRTIAERVAENVERIRRGEAPRNCVNAETVDRAIAAAKG